MKKLLATLTIVLISIFGSVNASDHNDEQNVVIHLSNYTNDLHSVNMALKLGHMLSEAGSSVTLFVDLEGVRLVDKHQPQNLTWGAGESIETLYNQFISAGGSVLVCPHCAKAAGVTEVRKGAVIADKDSLMKAITSADKILDY